MDDKDPAASVASAEHNDAPILAGTAAKENEIVQPSSSTAPSAHQEPVVDQPDSAMYVSNVEGVLPRVPHTHTEPATYHYPATDAGTTTTNFYTNQHYTLAEVGPSSLQGAAAPITVELPAGPESLDGQSLEPNIEVDYDVRIIIRRRSRGS